MQQTPTESTEEIERLLARLAPRTRETIGGVWLGRLMQHGAALVALAADEGAAGSLSSLPVPESLAAAPALCDTLMAVLEGAAEEWGDRVFAAGRQEIDWELVAQIIGPEQVTAWAAYIYLVDDLEVMIADPEFPLCVAHCGQLLRSTAAIVGGIRAGRSGVAVELIADAVGDEEAQRQRSELLAALPV